MIMAILFGVFIGYMASEQSYYDKCQKYEKKPLVCKEWKSK